MKLALAFCLIGVLFFAFPARADEDLAKTIFQARQNGQMVKNPSSIKPDLNMDQAYEVQTALAGLLTPKGGGKAGYKAALTGEAAQQKFGVNEPVYGILLDNMILEPGGAINPAVFKRLFIEVEMALFLNTSITGPLADAAAARACVEAVAPAIELPDVRLEDMKTLKGVDLVADNSGAAAVIVGPKIPLKDLGDIDAINIKLTKDGQVINEGQATDALGGQFEALKWLANAITSRGGKLTKGQFVITGAMGRMLPAKPGNYKAEYGQLGEITFSVK